MARLEHIRSTGSYRLASPHLVGRALTCTLRLASRLVSGTHAEFRWNGTVWELHDRGSRNGTFVNQSRLASGARMPVRAGAAIAFGDPEEQFALVDDAAPVATATSNSGQIREAEDGLLLLPDADNPAYTILEDGGRWLAEAGDGSRRPVAHGTTLSVGARVWRLDLPTMTESTWQPEAGEPVLHGIGLRFSVSRDEEHVEVVLVHRGEAIRLASRTHCYLLLELARARLAEQGGPGISEAEQGWVYVPELIDRLRINDNQLNVQICRARQQLARARVLGAGALFERRPASRQIRLGVSKLEVLPL